MKTLTRVLSTSFIDKYEYDMTMRNVITRDYFESVERTIDRINTTVDLLDVKMNKFEDSFHDFNQEIKAMNEVLKSKIGISEISRIESKFNAYSTLDRVQKIENRFVKYCRNDFAFELK